MAITLTDTAKLTKRALLFLGAFTFLLITLIISYQIWYQKYYLPNKPPVVEKPTTSFGKLPPPLFPASTTPSSSFSYTLSTDTGGLPTNLPTILKVYPVPLLGTTLLAPEKAQGLANSLGFGNGPDIQNPTQYQFTNDFGGILLIDLNTSNFKYQRVASSSATFNPILPNQDQLSGDFKGYLQGKNLLSDDLKAGRVKVDYSALSQKDATSAAITLWPDKLNNLEVVTDNPNLGLINTTISKAQSETDKYLKLDYTHWSPDPNTASTYPIKTATQALNDLKANQGVVILSPKTNQISLTSVKLAYFEETSYEQYIEPVFVFEGENFMAYVPAITSDWLSSQSLSKPNPSTP